MKTDSTIGARVTLALSGCFRKPRSSWVKSFQQLGSNMNLTSEEEIDRVWWLWKGWVYFWGSNLWPWNGSQNEWRTFACDKSLRFESIHLGHRCHCMYSLQPRFLLRLDWFVNHGELESAYSVSMLCQLCALLEACCFKWLHPGLSRNQMCCLKNRERGN